MFTSNLFAKLSASIAPSVMQTYIVVMIILVALGTIDGSSPFRLMKADLVD